MKTFFLLLFMSVLFSCNKRDVGGASTLSITLEPTFEQSAPNASASKASATAFVAADQIGVYAKLAGQDLRSAGNEFDNHRFVVQSDGTTIKGDPSDALYPDSKAMMDMFAYYPFDASVSDAKKVLFSVLKDQSTVDNLAKSDLCYASGSVLPSSSAQKLQFAHQLSRAIFNVTTPAGVTVSSIRVIGVATDVSLDMATGVVVNGSAMGDLTAISTSTTTATEFILPAQTIASGRALLEITFSDSQVSIYTPQQAVVLGQGVVTVFELTLNNSRTVTLVNPPTIAPWTDGSSSGEFARGVKNNFLVHWLLPHPDYATVDGAKLSVYNVSTDVTTDYPCDVTLKTGDASACSYSFDFAPSASDLLTYPYQIKGIKFYDKTTLVQECTSLIATNVYKSGDYTLGISQDNILDIRIGRIVDWGELNLSGDIAGGGVSNSFRIQMIDPWYAYKTITKISLTIDGVKYNFGGLGLVDGSNEFLATTTKFEFPDAAGLVPRRYPYSISRVDMYDATGALVDGTVSNIDVGRGGLISLQFYRGGVIAIQSPFGAGNAWGDVDGSGVIVGTGTKNKFSLRLIDFQHSLSAIGGVRFVSGGNAYLFSNVTATAGSNQFLASTTVFATPDSQGAFPLRYPYTISRVDVLDAAGLVLQSSNGSIDVFDTRDVAMQLYKNALLLQSTTGVGEWTDDPKTGDVSYGGLLAANLITLYYSDIKATNAAPCISVTKMTLTIGGKEVSLVVAMSGSGSSAKSSAAVSILTAQPLANLPLRYPYAITKVKLYDKDNNMLIESTLTTPVRVLGLGSISLRVVR